MNLKVRLISHEIILHSHLSRNPLHSIDKPKKLPIGDQPVRCPNLGFVRERAVRCAVVVMWPVLMSWGWLRDVISCVVSCHVVMWCGLMWWAVICCEVMRRNGLGSWVCDAMWLVVRSGCGSKRLYDVVNWKMMWWSVLQNTTSTTQYYKVLPSTAPYYKLLLRSTKYFKVRLRKIKYCKVLLRTTKNFSGLQSTTKYYSKLQ